MPIRPEERGRYPLDWAAVSLAVKVAAGWRCECRGECGWTRHVLAHEGLVFEGGRVVGGDLRCSAVHGQRSPFTGSVVVLTTAHLDHTPENLSPENLRAMCQGCHLSYDRERHAETRARTRGTPEPYPAG